MAAERFFHFTHRDFLADAVGSIGQVTDATADMTRRNLRSEVFFLAAANRVDEVLKVTLPGVPRVFFDGCLAIEFVGLAPTAGELDDALLTHDDVALLGTHVDAVSAALGGIR